MASPPKGQKFGKSTYKARMWPGRVALSTPTFPQSHSGDDGDDHDDESSSCRLEYSCDVTETRFRWFAPRIRCKRKMCWALAKAIVAFQFHGCNSLSNHASLQAMSCVKFQPCVRVSRCTKLWLDWRETKKVWSHICWCGFMAWTMGALNLDISQLYRRGWDIELFLWWLGCGCGMMIHPNKSVLQVKQPKTAFSNLTWLIRWVSIKVARYCCNLLWILSQCHRDGNWI